MDKEITLLRDLARQYAEAAAQDAQRERIAQWKRHNALKPGRPLVMIDQLPWNELNVDDELTLACGDPFRRSLEWTLRSQLYKWRHFPVDMVLDPAIDLLRYVEGAAIGPAVEEDISATDATNSVVSHRYHDRLAEPEDLALIHPVRIKADKQGDRERAARAEEVFGDIVPVRLSGVSMHCGLWDRISQLRGVEPILYDIADRPEFTLAIVERFVDAYMDLLDQYEALGLLDPGLSLIHCTGAYTDELPSAGYLPGKAKARDVWAYGLAQVLGSVSPAMYDEFELRPIRRLLDRFGLVYYGCCDPIDRKIELLRKFKSVRKISVSPWARKELCAELMHGDYVFSAKPNPAFLAGDALDEAAIRRDLTETVRICRAHHTSCELILKDVSTVRYRPRNLTRWAEIAMDVING